MKSYTTNILHNILTGLNNEGQIFKESPILKTALIVFFIWFARNLSNSLCTKHTFNLVINEYSYAKFFIRIFSYFLAV